MWFASRSLSSIGLCSELKGVTDVRSFRVATDGVCQRAWYRRCDPMRSIASVLCSLSLPPHPLACRAVGGGKAIAVHAHHINAGMCTRGAVSRVRKPTRRGLVVMNVSACRHYDVAQNDPQASG